MNTTLYLVLNLVLICFFEMWGVHYLAEIKDNLCFFVNEVFYVLILINQLTKEII